MSKDIVNPELGKAMPSSNPKYKGKAVFQIKEKAIPGSTYTLICPRCHNVFESMAANGYDELVKERCRSCRAVICYKTKANALKTDVDIKHVCLLATISWKGEVPIELRPGEYLIGQKDDEKPSDIAIKDTTVSRQSAKLTVLHDVATDNYKYLFTLLRTTNPVFVNSTKLYVGDSIYLNYGDVIKMGRTNIMFKKK